MGAKKVDVHDSLLKRRTFGKFEEWYEYTSAKTWTTTTTGSGAVAAAGVGGKLTFSPTDSTDNLYVYVASTASLLLFAADKPFELETSIQFSEANTSAANVVFGCMDSVSSTAMQDNGAGPKASFSGAVIYKVDGGTVWKCCSSLSTTQTISTSNTTAGGSLYQTLNIKVYPVSATVLEVTFFVNDQQLIDATSLKPIKHQVTYTGAAAMQFLLGVKNGSTTPETMISDYAAWGAIR